MVVPRPVVPHGGALGGGLGVGQGDCQHIPPPAGGVEEQLYGVHGLAHVSSAGGGDVVHHPRLAVRLGLQPLPHEADAPLDGRAHILGRQGLELKDTGPAENGVIHVKIGVLRGGGNEGQAAVLHELQQGLLLLLVKILNLVQVEQHPVGGQHGADLPHHVLDVRDGGGGGVEPVEGPVGAFGDDVGHRGFSRAGGAVKDQIGDAAAVNDAAQKAVLPQDMGLPHDLVQGLGADFVG